MKPRICALVICACIGISAAAWTYLVAAPYTAPTQDDGPAVQRWVPDERPRPAPPRPQPDRQRTLYADGIVLEHRRSKERVLLYFSREGRAVLGITTPAREELAAGLFASRETGYVQMADRDGIHVLSGAELSRGAGKLGAKPE